MLESRDSPHEPIIPGLPDDLALRCLARVSHGFHGLLETVSKKWREVTRGMEYANFKAREGWSGDWLFVLTEGSENQWVAYDPEADRWHPIPKMPRTHPDWKHTGFSCVCVGDRFLVIGGAYASNDPGFPHQKPIITNEVYQFNPFRKEWTMVSSMQTPRSHFACCVISGKVYVAGGRNLSCPRGLTLAECYNPLSNKYVYYCSIILKVLHFVLSFYCLMPFAPVLSFYCLMPFAPKVAKVHGSPCPLWF